jgi:predicted N-acyltransferase
VKLALHGGEPVAAADLLRRLKTPLRPLLGRRGADYHSLHFETCYHQGIEFCIERGLALRARHPGRAQDQPRLRAHHTWSAHYIADARFRDAIADYLRARGDLRSMSTPRPWRRMFPFTGAAAPPTTRRRTEP